jgi:hypothetical protein
MVVSWWLIHDFHIYHIAFFIFFFVPAISLDFVHMVGQQGLKGFVLIKLKNVMRACSSRPLVSL